MTDAKLILMILNVNIFNVSCIFSCVDVQRITLNKIIIIIMPFILSVSKLERSFGDSKRFLVFVKSEY